MNTLSTRFNKLTDEDRAYRLSNMAFHLSQAGHINRLYALIDRPWMALKYEYTFSHRAFADDVDLAIKIAVADETPNGLVQLVRNCLIYATLKQLTLQVSPELLGRWVQTGQTNKALADAELRGDAETYLAIARAQLKKNDFAAVKASLAQALQAAKALGDKEKQTHALCQVAEVWAQLKEPEQATLVIRCAQQVVQAIQNRDVRGPAMRAVVAAFVQMSDFDGALQATNTLDDKDYKLRWDYIDPALRDIVRGIAQVGQVDSALEVTVKISDKRTRAYALCDVAQTLAQGGEQEQAVQVINDAFRTAEAISLDKEKVDVFRDVVRVMAQVGEKNQAVQIADQVLRAAERWDKYPKADLLHAMAEALAELGESERAVQAAVAIGDIDYLPQKYQEQENTLQAVAQALVQAREFDGALRAAELMVGYSKEDVLKAVIRAKERALIAATKAMAKAGEFQAALRVVETITAEDLKAEAFSNIATALAHAGQFDHALQLLETIPLVHCKPQAFRDVIWVLVQIEEKVQVDRITSLKLRIAAAIGSEEFKALYDELQNQLQLFEYLNEVVALREAGAGGEVHESHADPLYPDIDNGREAETDMEVHESFRLDTSRDEPYKEQALGAIAQALAQVGEADHALQVTQAILNEVHRVQVLLGLVRTLAQAGRKQPADQIASYAVRVAESIEEISYDKLKLLGDAARSLMQAGQKAQAAKLADQAVHLVKSMVDTQSNDRKGLVDVAQVLVQAGQKAQAAKLANHVLRVGEGSEYISYGDPEVLSGVLQVLMQAGKKLQATKVANDTLHKLKLEKRRGWYDWAKRLEMLAAVTPVLVQTGKFNLALQAAETSFEDANFKAEALCEVAQAMAQAGLKQQAVKVVNQALQLTETIQVAYTKLEVLRKVAQLLVEVDEQEQLVKLANTALSSIQAIQFTYETSSNAKEALQGIIRILAQAGECDLALNLAEGIESSWVRKPILKEVAQALAESGELDRALSIATAMENGFEKEEALHNIARRLAQAGEFDRALQIAGEYADKAQVLCDVAQALLHRGEKAHAIHVAHDALRVLYSRGYVSYGDENVKSDVAYVLAQAGEFSRALQIVETIPAEKDHPLSAATHKEYALRQVLRSLAQGGESTQATIPADRLLQIAEGLSGPKNSLAKFDKHRFGQPPVLSEFAQAMAQTGMDDWVWRAVELISSTEDKIDTLRNMIQAVMEKRSHSEAQRFLNSTLNQARLLGREAVFGLLEKSVALPAFGDQGQMLWSVYEAITEVESWWSNKNRNGG